jgi:hypothetical protein
VTIEALRADFEVREADAAREADTAREADAAREGEGAEGSCARFF